MIPACRRFLRPEPRRGQSLSVSTRRHFPPIFIAGISKAGTTSYVPWLNQRHLFIPKKRPRFIHSDHLDRLDGYSPISRSALREHYSGHGGSNALEVACRDRINAWSILISTDIYHADPIDGIESSSFGRPRAAFLWVYPPFDLAAIEKLPDVRKIVATRSRQ